MLQKDLAETLFTAIIVSIKNTNESFNLQFKVMENCTGQQ